MSEKKDNEETIERLRGALEDLLPNFEQEDIPSESLPLGTYVRSVRFNTLGVIVDAFYGDVDVDGQKIIMYTILYTKNPDPYKIESHPSQIYVSNELEYEIIGYLMIPPYDVTKIKSLMTGGIL